MLAEAANSLGLVLLPRAKTSEAAEHFRETLRLKPDFAMACNNLGNALRLLGDLDGAVTHFRRATGIDPNLAEAPESGSTAAGAPPAARGVGPPAYCRPPAPGLAEARNNLGNALREAGRLAEAAAVLRRGAAASTRTWP